MSKKGTWWLNAKSDLMSKKAHGGKMHVMLKRDKKESHDKMYLKLKSDLIVKKEPHDEIPIMLQSDLILMLGTSCFKVCLYVQ